MINITTMKTERHEMLKRQWMEIIRRHSRRGQFIRQRCEENDISKGKFYYWQRVNREELLIKAGTLAVTGQTEFVEAKSSMAEVKSNSESTHAILLSNKNEIEVLNGADPNILDTLLS